MKRVIVFLMFIVFTELLNGQARIGSTEKEIIIELNENGIDSHRENLKNDDYFIRFETARAEVYYLFGNDKICYATAIFPKTQGDLNYYVEAYNKKYVIISATEWKMYSNEGITSIKLMFTEDKQSFFYWQ